MFLFIKVFCWFKDNYVSNAEYSIYDFMVQHLIHRLCQIVNKINIKKVSNLLYMYVYMYMSNILTINILNHTHTNNQHCSIISYVQKGFEQISILIFLFDFNWILNIFQDDQLKYPNSPLFQFRALFEILRKSVRLIYFMELTEEITFRWI